MQSLQEDDKASVSFLCRTCLFKNHSVSLTILRVLATCDLPHSTEPEIRVEILHVQQRLKSLRFLRVGFVLLHLGAHAEPIVVNVIHRVMVEIVVEKSLLLWQSGRHHVSCDTLFIEFIP